MTAKEEDSKSKTVLNKAKPKGYIMGRASNKQDS